VVGEGRQVEWQAGGRVGKWEDMYMVGGQAVGWRARRWEGRHV
jgi:hypothetical protein